MKAITIKQPWASLIVNNYKYYEFRSWKTNYRGRIYIHAGLSIDKAISDFDNYNLEYIKGAIIGEAEIVDCILVDDNLKQELLKQNKNVYKNSSGYAFVLENIKKYDKPIYIKGKLSLWDVNL